MAKCVLLFLFLSIVSCSNIEENPEDILVKFTQIGDVSVFEKKGDVLFPDTLSDSLWIMKIDRVSVWGIDGNVPDSLMKVQTNSIAVLGENAIVPEIMELQFSQIILKSNFPVDKTVIFFKSYKGIITNAADYQEIILTTDGTNWNR